MKTNEKPAGLIMIFGATGDLAKRKLFPSLYRLYKKGRLSDRFAVVGVARRPLSNDEFQASVKASVESAIKDNGELEDFISHFYYHSHDVTDSSSYLALKSMAEELDTHYSLEGNRIFYLAMAPEFFGTIVEHLKADGLTDVDGFNRLVIEKPFGDDLE